MGKFNFESYQNWFNTSFNKYDFYLDDGMFPDDGEIGMYESGYEISQLVFTDGMDVVDSSKDIGNRIPALKDKVGATEEPFEYKIDRYYRKWNIDINDCIKDVRTRFNEHVLLVPFLDKYLDFYEQMAEDFTGQKAKIPLREFIEKCC